MTGIRNVPSGLQRDLQLHLMGVKSTLDELTQGDQRVVRYDELQELLKGVKINKGTSGSNTDDPEDPPETDPVSALYGICGFFPSPAPTADEVLLLHVAASEVSFPEELTDSYASALVAATGATDLDIQVNGTSVGTVSFAASATDATLTSAGFYLEPGDQLTIVAPTTPDATLAGIAVTLLGER